ncbi:MAG TPA: hypothetical protein VFW96_11405 [Thermomicrobiales bacterium]|nr:hypothetical protein [Thermomicrobiales bacterium]
MWQSRLFGSLPMLLEFVNERRLTHDRFKIAIVPPRVWQRRGRPRYYLIYWVEDEERETATATARGEARANEEEAAVDTAARIIAGARQRGEDEPR